jgi:predicted phosphodiesterase
MIGFSRAMEIEADFKKSGFSFSEIAKKMAQSGKLDIVFYGHTHKPGRDCR